ncbi:hypothetical protein BCF44_101975 [Kutzneria buriramensis]|uniref:Uncharacterized protein n=1 Tax=Kutzneria buriramensis TaxID=1045776 RepID=A0A3E0IB87_9PSEU|nr:hypothetical protein BCF44_101975 [Kutzneria buriramensis]
MTGIIVTVTDEGLGWYGVRCVFRWIGYENKPYEERITLWRATSLTHAIELAGREARGYAHDHGFEYLDFAQAYALDAGEIGSGTEVFSLLRDSYLKPDSYLDSYFDTGGEHQTS